MDALGGSALAILYQLSVLFKKEITRIYCAMSTRLKFVPRGTSSSICCAANRGGEGRGGRREKQPKQHYQS